MDRLEYNIIHWNKAEIYEIIRQLVNSFTDTDLDK